MKRARAVTLEEFQELLRTGNLLSIDELTQVVGDMTHESFHESREFARWLVERKWVTRWQAQMMLAGKNRFFLGKYKLLERVGAGGMGTVFKARQTGLGRIVALKVMSDALLEDEQAVARFHREIRSAAALEHPNIVATFDADSVGGKHFLVMEFVEGENLQVLAKRRGKLPMAEACEYVRQVALGLAHAHDRGMIHRDIKPANLLIAAPIVKILDFGLARLSGETHGDTALTQTGQIMGTPDYIAPEQARDIKAADIRSDIYSLGCTLFRLLAGEVPFKGQSVMEKLMARALEEAPRVRSLRPDLPVELDECLARMMARDPAARIQTPAEVASAMSLFAVGAVSSAVAPAVSEEAYPAGSEPFPAMWSIDSDPASDPDPGLERFLAVLATEAEDVSGLAEPADDTARSGAGSESGGSTRVDAAVRHAPPEPRAARRRATSSQKLTARSRPRSLIALAVLPAVFLILGGGLLWYRSGTAWIEIEWPEAERKGATLEIDGREPVLAGRLAFSARPGRRTLRMTRKGYEPIEEEWVLARGERKTYRPEWKLTPVAARRREFVSLQAEIERLASPFSGAFARQMNPEIVAVRGRCSDFIHRWLKTREARQIAAGLRRLPAPVDDLRRNGISPYELRIAGGGNPRAAPPELVAVIGDSRLKHAANILTAAFSPSDAWLATGDELGFVKIWDSTTGAEVRSFRAHSAHVMSLAFSPDGQTLMTGSVDTTAKLWNLATFAERHVLGGHKEQIRAVAFSPQGDLVATAGLEKFIKLWNPADGTLVRTIDEDVVYFASLAFSPDGKSLAVGCGEPFTALVLNVADGSRRYPLNGHEQAVASVAWNPDGTKLATGCLDARTRLFNAADGKEVRTTFAGQHAGITAVAFSPDGTTLAAASGDGTIDVRNVESGAPESTMFCHDSGLTQMAFSHRGRRLATTGGDHSIRFWDATNGKETVIVGVPIRCLAASPDGRWLALGNADGTTQVWDIAAGKKHFALPGTRHWPAALVFSPDGSLLAVGGNGADRTIRVWDVASQSKLHVIDAHSSFISGLDFSPDARVLVSSSLDGLVKLWSVETGGIIEILDGQAGSISALALSRDGRVLAAAYQPPGPGAYSVVKLWNVARREETRTLEGVWHPVTGIAFGSDDKALAVGHSSQGVRLWNLSKGAEPDLKPGTGILAVNPETGLLALDTTSGIALYDPAFSTPIAELSLGSADLQAVQIVFTPEGRHLAVLAGNGTVRILRLPADKE